VQLSSSCRQEKKLQIYEIVYEDTERRINNIANLISWNVTNHQNQYINVEGVPFSDAYHEVPIAIKTPRNLEITTLKLCSLSILRPKAVSTGPY
jgi:hypothetical protein